MKLKLSLLSLLILLFSCKEAKDNKEESSKPELGKKGTSLQNLNSYSNSQWHFSLKYPQNYITTGSDLPGDVPVINIYERSVSEKPPFAIHEEAGIGYIAILPKGYGVDGPSGKSSSFLEWSGSLELKEDIDPEESRVYLLENGEPWAFKLKFSHPPKSWNEYGSVFVHFKADAFKAECEDSGTGEKKPMEGCDPMGSDIIKFTGEINENSYKSLKKILEDFKFSKVKEGRKVSNIIKVDRPLPNIEVKSPLKISGKAKGFWFFEGTAPLKLVDKDNKILAESSIEAEGNWMTSDFVPFNSRMTFDSAPDDERGYLVFERANPSGKPENDQSYRLPVLFPPK
ncbi:Gmad2 immunoglobulin-like domain-containing protein [Salegentibacter chungangensis]|uniref:Gmad2 immunoglobulin-like domain-containing protein n=1 Tax=Salegentibacter chungangensis TaxID=1335724 RepID=A0ABW3NR29_9FLAO